MSSLLSTRPTQRTRIVCISDTHNKTLKLPKGDVLIHAGDLTNQGSLSELRKTLAWLEEADFEARVVVAGEPCSLASLYRLLTFEIQQATTILHCMRTSTTQTERIFTTSARKIPMSAYALSNLLLPLHT